jgi:hypothetical protein
MSACICTKLDNQNNLELLLSHRIVMACAMWITKSAAPILERMPPLQLVFEQVPSPLHDDALSLLTYWRAREIDGGFVVGRDIPSRKIASVLRNIALSEPIGNSRNLEDMRTRLAGDVFRLRFGCETSGMRLSELFEPDDFEAHISQIAVALHRGTPYMVRSALRRGAFVEQRYEDFN